MLQVDLSFLLELIVQFGTRAGGGGRSSDLGWGVRNRLSRCGERVDPDRGVFYDVAREETGHVVGRMGEGRSTLVGAGRHQGLVTLSHRGRIMIPR